MASKSCFANGVDHCLSSRRRKGVCEKLRRGEGEMTAGRIARELRGLRALEAVVMGLKNMVVIYVLMAYPDSGLLGLEL